MVLGSRKTVLGTPTIFGLTESRQLRSGTVLYWILLFGVLWQLESETLELVRSLASPDWRIKPAVPFRALPAARFKLKPLFHARFLNDQWIIATIRSHKTYDVTTIPLMKPLYVNTRDLITYIWIRKQRKIRDEVEVIQKGDEGFQRSLRSSWRLFHFITRIRNNTECLVQQKREHHVSQEGNRVWKKKVDQLPRYVTPNQDRSFENTRGNSDEAQRDYSHVTRHSWPGMSRAIQDKPKFFTSVLTSMLPFAGKVLEKLEVAEIREQLCKLRQNTVLWRSRTAIPGLRPTHTIVCP